MICHIEFLITRCARTEQSPRFYSCAKYVSAIRSYTLWGLRRELNSSSAPRLVVTQDTNVYTVLDKPRRKYTQQTVQHQINKEVAILSNV